MSPSLELRAPCHWQGALDLLRRADAFLRGQDLSEGELYAAALVLEELVLNVVRHAHDDPRGRELSVELEPTGQGLRLVVSDDGRPFDPTTVPEPVRPATLQDARPGGLGLCLVRAMAQFVSYRREQDRNVVEVLVREPDWQGLADCDRHGW